MALAAWMWLFGQRLWVLKATSLLCFAGAAGLGYVLVARQADTASWVAASAVLLFVLNMNSVQYASTVVTEMPFALAGVAALLALERTASAERRRWAWGIGAAALIAVAIYLRPNGLSLIPAALAYLLLRKQWREGMLVAALAVAAVLPWTWRETEAAASGEHTYLSRTLGSTEEDAPRLSGVAKYLHRVGKNGAAHALSLGQSILARPAHVSFAPVMPEFPAPGKGSVNPGRDAGASEQTKTSGGVDWGHVSRYLLAAIVVVGSLVTWRGAGSSMHWYVIFTIAMLLVTPWPRGRYLFPLLPFFGWFFVASIVWLAGLTRRWMGEHRAVKIGGLGVAAACGLAALFTSMSASQQLIANLRCRGLPDWAAERYVYQGPDLVNYMRAIAWIKDNTPRNAVMACRKPYQVYWITERRAQMVWNESIEGAWRGFQGLQQFGPVYIIEDTFGGRYEERRLTERYWGPALAAHSGETETMLETDVPRTRVVRLRGAVTEAEARPDEFLSYLRWGASQCRAERQAERTDEGA